jgi:predicted RNA-binding protein with PUA-like domain
LPCLCSRVSQVMIRESEFNRKASMRYWLMKSEPSDVSIDDLASFPNQTVDWYGIRNYQARNFMRDQMKLGDQAFFYHSNCDVPGIAGIVEVSKLAYPDRTQFDPKHRYFEPKSTPENPRWVNVDVKLIRKTRLLSLKELREYPELATMRILQRGNRLSITPVDPKEWAFILTLLK